MSEQLYNERIVALARAKEGAGRLEQPTVTVDCDNPLCGDRIQLDLRVEDGKVEEIGHKTRGCILTQAGASLIARLAPGHDARALAEFEAAARAVLAGPSDLPPEWAELEVFAPVRTVRSRQDCVLLPFRALARALALAAVQEPKPGG